MSQQSMSGEITSEDKLWAALCYIPIAFPIVAIVVFFMDDKKNREFIKYHAVQALAVGTAGILLSFLCVGILIILYMWYLAYDAYQGNYTKVPFATDFIKNQGWV